MVAKKRKSKRNTLQQKYKIQKRTKEHHKRIKKGQLTTLRNKKIDNTIPNAWPHKEDLLNQIKAAKEKMEVVRLAQKEKRRADLLRKRAVKRGEIVEDDGMDEESASDDDEDDPFEADLKQRRKKNMLHLKDTGYESGDASGDEERMLYEGSYGQNSRRAFLKELRKTVDGSDVILQVLDARDPLGTLSTAVQEMVAAKAENKKLVYVLNKSDLVPREVLVGWLRYLRRNYPAIPFKCNTQQGQSKNLGRVSGKVGQYDEVTLRTNQAVGAEELLGLLKNYSRFGNDSSKGKKDKTSIVVGVVGFPNVGKSSLINSLMRIRAVGVSAMPGYTKKCQEVILDKNIRLLDSPGVVFADGDHSATALRNCVNIEELEDVMTPIGAILERCPSGYLMQLYNIPAFKNNDITAFLAHVAKSSGKLKKGGIPNIDASARTVLHDWNSGRIRYYCKPPELKNMARASGKARGEDEEGDTQILSGFSTPSALVSEGGWVQETDDSVLNTLSAMKSEMRGELTAEEGYVGLESVATSITPYTDENTSTATATATTSTSSKRKKRGVDTLVLTEEVVEQEEEDHPDDDSDDDDDDREEEETDPAQALQKHRDMLEKRKRGNKKSMLNRRVEAIEAPPPNARKVAKAALKKVKKQRRQGKD